MRDWEFLQDMNRDGVVTITDLWLWVKWLYFYPGDSVIKAHLGSPVGTFFEFTPDSYGGLVSFFISGFAWFVLLPVAFVWTLEIIGRVLGVCFLVVRYAKQLSTVEGRKALRASRAAREEAEANASKGKSILERPLTATETLLGLLIVASVILLAYVGGQMLR